MPNQAPEPDGPGAARRGIGWTVIAVAGLYCVIVVASSILLVSAATGDYESMGTFQIAALEPLRALTMPASMFTPESLMDAGEINRLGTELMLLGLAQGLFVATLGWLLVCGREQRKVAGAVATLCVAALVGVGAVSHEPALALPDRSDPVVQAEEARLASLIGASGAVDGERASCRVRLLATDETTSFVNARCSYGITELVMPFRVDGAQVSRASEFDQSDEARVFPREVRRALIEQYRATRP
jgi:hypothetical protein